jgi:predicted DNA-binding protein with PD1-like motif
MKSKLLSDGAEKTWALVLETGDEAAACLAAFAKEKGLRGSHFTAIGAFQRATLGYYDWELKKYHHIPVNEQVEVLSLIGDIAIDKSEPKAHVHAVVGLRDGSTKGGHLIEGVVRPTLEIIITELPVGMQKKFDEASQLALIAL